MLYLSPLTPHFLLNPIGSFVPRFVFLIFFFFKICRYSRHGQLLDSEHDPDMVSCLYSNSVDPIRLFKFSSVLGLTTSTEQSI